ncbi:hypothetical protein Tco_0816759 [Tanacetum coccineum]
MNSSYSSYHLYLPQPKSTRNSTNASSSNPSKKIKLTKIPPRQLFFNISSDEEVTTTPSPTTTSSSPTPPNAPSKTSSTNQTSSSQDNTSSSFQSKLQISPSSPHDPTSLLQPLKKPPLLENILDDTPNFKPSTTQDPSVLCISLYHYHHHTFENLSSPPYTITTSTSTSIWAIQLYTKLHGLS